MVKALEDGMGVKFSVVIDGKLVDFTLGLIQKEASYEVDGKKNVLVFFKEDTDLFYEKNLYSGGLTGFGINSYEIGYNLEKSKEAPFKILVRNDPIKALEMFEQLAAEKDALLERKLAAYKENVVDVLNAKYNDTTIKSDIDSNYFVKFKLKRKASSNLSSYVTIRRINPCVEGESYYFTELNERDSVYTPKGKIKSRVQKDFCSFSTHPKEISDLILVELLDKANKIQQQFIEEYRTLNKQYMI